MRKEVGEEENGRGQSGCPYGRQLPRTYGSKRSWRRYERGKLKKVRREQAVRALNDMASNDAFCHGGCIHLIMQLF